MDIASILNELWRRRTWVGVGLVVAGVIALSVVFKLPSFEAKSDTTGAASTDVLVDTRSSALGSIAIDVNDLTARAAVYGRMIGTTAVKERIARLADVRPEQIGVLDMGLGTPVPTTATAQGSPEPQPPEGLKIGATTLEAHPAVKLEAFAPTAAAAKKLANASADALIDYVAGVQEQRAVPARERVVLRQLGTPQAVALVNGADYAKAIAVFIGLTLAWCLLVLIVSRTADALRELRAPTQLRTPDEGRVLIGLWDNHAGNGRADELQAPRAVAPPSRRLRP